MADSKDFQNFFDENSENSSLNIKENVELLMRNWYWFVISALLLVVLAYFYLKYQQNIYQANASVLIEDQNGIMGEELNGLTELFGTKNNVEDKTYIFKSIPLNRRVVDNLNLDVSLSRKTSLSKKLVEYYKNAPLTIVKIAETEEFHTPLNFQIEILDENHFNLISNGEQKSFPYDKILNINDKTLIKVSKNPECFESADPLLFVTLSPRDEKTMSLIEGLSVQPAEKLSSVLLLSYQSNDLNKSKDVLNELIRQYSINAVADKKQITENTATFIDERIGFLTDELSNVERNIEDFKQNNKLTDIVTEAKIYSDNSSDINNQLVQTEMKYKIVDYLSQYLNQNANALVPTNIGFDDPQINYQVNKYNEMILERNRYEKSTTPDNPEFKLLQENINSLKRSIAQELSNQKGSLNITISGLKTQNNVLNNKLQNIPKQEREYREIFRQQQTKEALFLFLLQKKEEVAIAGISITPDFTIINNAFGSLKPVSPNTKLIYLIALILGLTLPVVFIYVNTLLDTKIHSTKDLENITPIPIIGNISKVENATPNLILSKTDRSSAAESLRLLVTNLEFALEENKSCKTVLVTSTLSGEGKTFVSANLATSLAYNGYKTLLLGMDIRAPKIHEYYPLPNQKGVTHFVRNENLEIKDIINHLSEYPNLDIIVSGNILPNFIDILTNKRIQELFENLKKEYDFIIIDSAPVGLVSDTFNISKYIDFCLYVVRANYLDKRMINVVERINKDKKFPKTYLVLNDVDIQSKKYGNAYGYGYGYGYGEDSQAKKYKKWHPKYWLQTFKKRW